MVGGYESSGVASAEGQVLKCACSSWRSSLLRGGIPPSQDLAEERQLLVFCPTSGQELHAVEVTRTVANHAS